MPATFLGDGGLGRLTQALQEVFEPADGELGAGLTGGRGTAIDAGELGEMATGCVAMENLPEEQLYGAHRSQEAVTPRGIPYGCTSGVDRLGFQLDRPIG